MDYISIHLDYDEDNCKFHDYYRIVEGAEELSVRFDVTDLDKGIIKGSVAGKLLPSILPSNRLGLRASGAVGGRGLRGRMYTVNNPY